MDIISAYRETDTYRGAAVACGTTHKTVKRVIARHQAGGVAAERAARGHNYDGVAELVAARVNTSGDRNLAIDTRGTTRLSASLS